MGCSRTASCRRWIRRFWDSCWWPRLRGETSWNKCNIFYLLKKIPRAKELRKIRCFLLSRYCTAVFGRGMLRLGHSKEVGCGEPLDHADRCDWQHQATHLAIFEGARPLASWGGPFSFTFVEDHGISWYIMIQKITKQTERERAKKG